MVCTKNTENNNLPRRQVLNIPAVVYGKTSAQLKEQYGVNELVLMNCNENPLGSSPLAIKAIQEEALNINRYPESGSSDLRQKLANHYGIEREMVLCSNGGDNIITTLMQTFLDEGDELVVGHPSFFVYGHTSGIMGAKLIKVPLKDYTYDLAAILQAVTPKTKMVIICNPNNPTSTILRQKEVDEFIAVLPQDCLVVFDEAYREFVEDKNYPDSLKYVKEDKNVLIIRTFSKLYGLAGLRIGYCLAPQKVMTYMARVVETFPVNRLAQVAAMAALDDKNFVTKVKAANALGKAYLIDELAKLGMKTAPAYANFIFTDTGMDSIKLVKELEKRGILIRPAVSWGFPTCVRISIGTQAENEKLVKAIQEIKDEI